MKWWPRGVILAVALLAMTSCDNSKKTAVARCALDAAKINPAESRPRYTWNCMRLAGYEFYGGLCGGIYAQADDAACYVPVSFSARIYDWIDGALGL